MKNYIILFLFPFFSYSQITLEGFIRDQDKDIIPFVTVQLLKENTIVSYTTSDDNGYYVLKSNNTGSFTVKLNHISFLAKEEIIVLKDKINKQNFELKEDQNTLDEVKLNFEPKIVEISQDTITYNLKALTNGSENSLAEIIDKLPGVQIDESGLISVNGKTIKKMLIDGEELFKKQHRLTAESITSDMVEGIRYLDKFKDFGNIQGFDNKEMEALDITIKDEYKNKITGDLFLAGGHREKVSLHTNLYRLGGKLKVGFIGDFNNLGKPSITSYEYDQLTESQNGSDFSDGGTTLSNSTNQSFRFFDPTIDIASRENTFGALSFIYKPEGNVKLSLLNLISNTDQIQRSLLERSFFNTPSSNQIEDRNLISSFLLNSSIFELGYQPFNLTFVSYNASFHPSQIEESLNLISTVNENRSSISESRVNNRFNFDQNLSVATRIHKNTLLKLSGLAFFELNEDDLDIRGTAPFLNLNFDSNFRIRQLQNSNKHQYGYELQTLSTFDRSKLNFRQGIFKFKDKFENEISERSEFGNNVITDRTDSYIGVEYRDKITKRLRYKIEGEYRYLFYKRKNRNFEEFFFLPSVRLDYRINVAKRIDFEYKYNFELPESKLINNGRWIESYLTSFSRSQLLSDTFFPTHSLLASYSSFKSSGSTFFLFSDYNYSPRFLSLNSFLDENNVVNSEYVIGENRRQLFIGLRSDSRLRKLKLNLFTKINYSYQTENNFINSVPNITITNRYNAKIGLYSRYRSKVNFSIGVNYLNSDYLIQLNNTDIQSISTTPYLYLNGFISKKKLKWRLGVEYASYNTDETETNFLNIIPNITYKISDLWELRVEGNNILNIDNSEITQNSINVNFSENRIDQTLEGYIVFGVYYRLK